MTEPSRDALNLAIAHLAEVPEVQVRGAPEWQETERRWVLPLRFTIPDLAKSEFIQRVSDWYALVGGGYPWAPITIWPSEEGGITGTFPHQLFNESSDHPWTHGQICVSTDVHALDSRGFEREPTASGERLAWTVRRAVEWVRRAAQGSLVAEGDPFELPPFPRTASNDETFAHAETHENLLTWTCRIGQAGTCELAGDPENELVTIVRRFDSSTGRRLLDVPWGTRLQHSEHATSSAWILLPECPVEAPWTPPKTWGDLKRICQNLGVDMVSQIGQVANSLRDGETHLLLVGFPIPAVRGGSRARIHWQAARLPPLTSRGQAAPGFHREASWPLLDGRLVLRDSKDIEWIRSENWARDQLLTRGGFGTRIRHSPIVLIGAGSLASHVAEQLVRGGAQELVIIDPEDMTGGNVGRHTLGIDSVGRNKAVDLATRLNRLSPHARCVGLPVRFPALTNEALPQLQRGQLIIDCTGSDLCASAMGTFPWETPRLFCSASIGLVGRRLYFFTHEGTTFPFEDFRQMTRPWLEDDLDNAGAEALAREGIGCWNPVTVTRVDAVARWASETCRLLDRRSELRAARPELTVRELSDSGTGGSIGEGRPLADVAQAWTDDSAQLRVLIVPSVLQEFRVRCDAAGALETGGLLLGRYLDEQSALVTSISGPPPDSVQQPMTFTRGTEGVDTWLHQQQMEHGRYYLGEWHFHPDGSTTPSPTDKQQMKSIARNPDYNCPEPILVVAGDSNHAPWIGVFSEQGPPLVLTSENDGRRGSVR